MAMPKTKYSLEDISRHNGVLDARIWIIIRESVYDVTDYLNKHPGGSELIMEYAGRNATTAFNDFGHSSDAINTMKTYKIGEVIEEDQSRDKKKKNMTKNNINDERNENTKERHRRLLFPLFRSCRT